MKKEQYIHFLSDIQETKLGTFSFTSQKLIYRLRITIIIIITMIVRTKCKMVREIFSD